VLERVGIELGFRELLLLDFSLLFVICMLCHGQLARLKPPTQYLTAYYLMIAAGGALGGIAVSIIAPRVFRTIFEWQLAIFIAAMAFIFFGSGRGTIVSCMPPPFVCMLQFQPIQSQRVADDADRAESHGNAGYHRT